jgi:hypothetical protein
MTAELVRPVPTLDVFFRGLSFNPRDAPEFLVQFADPVRDWKNAELPAKPPNAKHLRNS